MSAITLATLGLKALEWSKAMELRRAAEANLNQAYVRFKEANGIGRIERHTNDWDAMMAATAAEYGIAQKARTAERSKQRALGALCRKALPELEAAVATDRLLQSLRESAVGSVE